MDRRDAGPLIRLQGLSKRFAVRKESLRSFQDIFINLVQLRPRRTPYFWALRDISFEVHQGDCFGIIGPNGSGKSTLLKVITGILEPTSGEVFTRGRIASLLELGAGFHPELTGRENIFLNGSVYGLSRRQIQRMLSDIIDYAELGDFIDAPIKHYSSGMHVRLGFSVAIHVDPDVLLVDEVLAVGDVAFQQKCLDSIARFRAAGGTLLFISHDLDAVQSLCNRAIWLEHGAICAEGNPTDVAMSYLGHVAGAGTGGPRGEVTLPEVAGPRWGTGLVQVTGVQLCDGHGVPAASFVTGEAMEIRLHYRAAARVRNPVFGIGIHHQSGVHVSGPNTQLGGLDIPFVEGEGQVTYHIDALPLLAGAYALSVAVVDGADLETFDYHDRAYTFRVAGGRSQERHGVVSLGGAWRLAPVSSLADVVRGAAP